MTTSRRIDPIGWLVEKVQQLGLEWLIGRYYGIYKAIVIDVADEEQRGRIRVMCPDVGQFKASSVPKNIWALPCFAGASVGTSPHGMMWVPELGDQVWVTYQNGKLEFPVYMGGFFVRHDNGNLKDAQGRKKGLRTKTGHYLVFDDVDGSVKIARGDGSGGTSGSVLSLGGDGSVVLMADDGSHVFMNPNGDVTLVAKDGSYAAVGNDRVQLINKSGSAVYLHGGKVEVICNGDFIVKAGGKISLDGGAVDLGSGAVEPTIRGQSLATTFATHFHTSSPTGGPTSPPTTPPLVLFNELSGKVRVA